MASCDSICLPRKKNRVRFRESIASFGFQCGIFLIICAKYINLFIVLTVVMCILPLVYYYIRIKDLYKKDEILLIELIVVA